MNVLGAGTMSALPTCPLCSSQVHLPPESSCSQQPILASLCLRVALRLLDPALPAGFGAIGYLLIMHTVY